MEKYALLDLNTGKFDGGLETLFPGWNGAQERLCVYSPHDDDAILGAGYAMRAALDSGAQVHIFIVCSGNAGYSTVEAKDTIVETRKRETLACYAAFGIPAENIVFLDFSDFSALSSLGWQVAPDREGHFHRTIAELRARKITRILAPNHYREHIDHIAASMMAAYDAPQCGDAMAVDWGEPTPVLSVAEYSVWADLDPEDALLHKRDPHLRANTVLVAAPEVEECVCNGIRQYASQQEIIAGLIEQRQERRLGDGRYVEVYLRFDPRPKLDFSPYRLAVERALS
ncbi:MAG TPA: PIG-L family deacetylase [Candidatus Pullichristensenella avicola]|nr:PIG-L family deacetylase [Candidatus Pullichristensenella avicola]